METTTLELELTETGAQFTPLELKLPETLTLDAWAKLGRKLHRSRQVIHWWIGDWAAFGERKYGALKEFATANGIDYGRLRNIVWVSEAVEPSRRRDNLEWGFHQEVAPLKPKEQSTWLDRAASDHLTVANLRKQIRISNGDTNALESEGKSMRLLTKFYDDFVAELQSKPVEFWTLERKGIWRDRLAWFSKFADGL